jgi:quinoprotein glucose dehydrogenase
MPLRLLLVSFALSPLALAADQDWPVYLGDAGATHFSSLAQITRANVARLAPAWTYHAGEATATSQIQCNPLIVDGVLYGTSPRLVLFALNAATGRELWRFDPYRGAGGREGGLNRGLVFWREGEERRILFSAGSFLYSIDPGSGHPMEDFGERGRIDLHDGLDREARGLYVVGTSPGAVYRDLLIVSNRMSEGPGPAAPGHIRAYDVRTGQRRWIFHTIPHPGEKGHETWSADSWLHSGAANNWAGLTIDQARGLAFVPTGSATYDFWGGDRLGDNLFANCLLALDAATGRLKWHFQFVHHDLWDRDLPAPPVLCTVTHAGRRIAAVAQITKSGHVWVFDRETGESLFPWREQPIPASALDGEVAARTEPVPLAPAPFARQQFTEDEVTDRTPAAHEAVLKRLREAHPHVPFFPPSTRGTVILPGFDGGGEWGGAAVDPAGILYVNANEMAWILQMIPVRTPGASLGQALYTQLCTACHGPARQGNAAANVPSLVNLGAKIKPADAAALLRTGRNAMPAFAFLNPAQRTALVDFLFDLPAAFSPPPALPAAPADGRDQAEPTGDLARTSSPYTTTGYNRFLDPDGYPALRPPWGTLNALDLNTGRYLWRRPLGELPELTA